MNKPSMTFLFLACTGFLPIDVAALPYENSPLLREGNNKMILSSHRDRRADLIKLTNGSQVRGSLKAVPVLIYPFGAIELSIEKIDAITVSMDDDQPRLHVREKNGAYYVADVAPNARFILQPARGQPIQIPFQDITSVQVFAGSSPHPQSDQMFSMLEFANGTVFPLYTENESEITVINNDDEEKNIRLQDLVELQVKTSVQGTTRNEDGETVALPLSVMKDDALTVQLGENSEPISIPWKLVSRVFLKEDEKQEEVLSESKVAPSPSEAYIIVPIASKDGNPEYYKIIGKVYLGDIRPSDSENVVAQNDPSDQVRDTDEDSDDDNDDDDDDDSDDDDDLSDNAEDDDLDSDDDEEDDDNDQDENNNQDFYSDYGFQKTLTFMPSSITTLVKNVPIAFNADLAEDYTSDILALAEPEQTLVGKARHLSSRDMIYMVFVDRAFYIDKHPINNQQYAWFIEDTGREAPTHWVDGQFPEGEESLPVTNISYQDAQDYADWIGHRLPTAIEWLRANPNDFASSETQPIKEWTSSEFTIQPQENSEEEWLEENSDASGIYRAVVYGAVDQGIQPLNEYDHAQDIGFRTVLDPIEDED